MSHLVKRVKYLKFWARLVVQSSTRTTYQHARQGFIPRIDGAPIRRA